MEFNGTIIDRQRELEIEMLDLGTENYRKTISSNREHGREHISNYGLVLTTHAIRPLELAIKKFLDPSTQGNGSGAVAGGVTKKWFRESKVDADTLALITINTVMDAITASEPPRVQSITTRIAKRVQSEMKLLAYKKTHPRLFNYAFKNALSQAKQGTWLESYLLDSMFNTGSGGEGVAVEYPIWETKQRHQIGAQLLNLLIQTTGLVAIRTVTKRGKGGGASGTSGRPMSRAIVEATAESKQFINAVIQRTEQLSTYRLPMLIPPRSWSGDIENSAGGYWFLPDDTLRFMKPNRGCPSESLDAYYMEHLAESWGSDNLLALANRLQNVPFSVNKFILDSALTERGIYEPLPLPDASEYLDTNSNPKEVAARAAQIHILNRSNMGKHMLHSRTVATASRFRDELAIFFPHIADFRGRVYSVGSHLNRMGNDLQRGLLRFTRGKEVSSGSIGERMLMIEASNAYGLDKVSYDERVQFIEDHRHELDSLTASAENKYQFMAVAEELERLSIHGKINSHVVCNRDATCSGLQHFSAMLRDKDGGASVNLDGTRRDNQPDSIYIDVAARLTRKISVDILGNPNHRLSNGDKKWAVDWLNIGIDKSITKRSVMTLVYGLTKHSSRVYVEEALKEGFESGSKVKPDSWRGKDLFHPTLWLNQLLWEAIQEQLVGACEAMKYLRDAVAHYIATADNKAVTWTTPYDSLPILSDYRVVKSEHVVKTVIGERSIKLALNPQRGRLKDRVAFEATVNAIAANYVHSCDAALLRALEGQLEGAYPDIDVSCIHDSIGVHAVDVPVMEEAIRRAFVEMYPAGSNPLQLFGDQMGYTDRLAPELGDLDLEAGVMESDYFFS